MFRMFTKAAPFSFGVLHEKAQYLPRCERRHIKIPLGIICSELNEVTNEKCDKNESTCNTADLGNCPCKVI